MSAQPSATLDDFIRQWVKRMSPETRNIDECWFWRKQGRYATISIGPVGAVEKMYAHRVAFAWLHGRLPRKNANHTCDNKSCSNPYHVYDGTQQDNRKDMIARGGWTSPNRKLSETEVSEIRQMYSTGEVSQLKLAKQFSVSQVAISNIVRGRTYV